MFYVDEALLNLIESACRQFQLLTGRTNVWLAFQLTNLSIVVYFVLAAVYFLSSRRCPNRARALLRRTVVLVDPDNLQGDRRSP